MNDDEQDLNACNSKCWQCKFGMCLDETQRQTLMHQGMTGMDGEGDVFEPEPWQEQPECPAEIIHQVESARSGAICYWGAMNIDPAQPPIRVEFVTDCSRFKLDKQN